MISKYALGAIGAALAVLILLKVGGDIRENKLVAKHAKDLIKAVEEAKLEAARLNNDLGKIQNAKNKAIAQKPVNNNDDCINPAILGLLDQITDSVPDNP